MPKQTIGGDSLIPATHRKIITGIRIRLQEGKRLTSLHPGHGIAGDFRDGIRDKKKTPKKGHGGLVRCRGNGRIIG
jgi:hypothetical protein